MQDLLTKKSNLIKNRILIKNQQISIKNNDNHRLIFRYSLNPSFSKLLFILGILIFIFTNPTTAQDDFDIHNHNYQQINEGFNDDRMEIPQQRMGGAHPAFQNMDNHVNFGGPGMPNRRFNHQPGMMGEMMGGRNHRHGGRNFHNNNGMQMNNFNSNPQEQVFSNNKYNNNQSHGPFGIFNSSFANSIYEIFMMIFLLGFIYNCFCGKNANDKYALAWYNANKQYFEERYSELGIKNGEDDVITETDSLPIIKDSPYLYKFYAAGYRYIKWLLVVLEFRKRQDTISLFTAMLFPAKDRIIFEVGIEPTEEDISWVFCVCNRRDSKNLKKDHQDIDFFCNSFEPSIMSDRLVLLSESDELYCDLFQNKVKYITFFFRTIFTSLKINLFDILLRNF